MSGRYLEFASQWYRAHPQYTWKEAIELAKPDYYSMMGKYLPVTNRVGSGSYGQATKFGPKYG